MTDWLSSLPRDWAPVAPRVIFRERREASTPSDTHLTPSQHLGVLPQAEYMERTGSKVVLNLAGADTMKHVEPNDFIAHLRSFQGGLEWSPQAGKVSNAYTVISPRRPMIPAYYRWVLKSTAFIQELAASSQQLRDGQSVKFDDLSRIRLPEPPLAQQRRIADFLDDRVARIDQIIAARKDQASRIDETATSVLAGELLTRPHTQPLRRFILDERLGLWGNEPGELEIDVQIARVADFSRSTFTLGAVTTTRSASRAQVNARRLIPGDILLERSGGTQMAHPNPGWVRKPPVSSRLRAM